ncbi:uncharacterized protein LACBIDRAFT_247029 [Laccaria bicolor S238N-H82]|uniref:Conserved oligomeric Golgi complex subunit 2 n=1 Tax=Laccaria bicolor (strain S238N-H82 / ATCC MYA-4686) TaxID=486041 RepID=B0D0M4_LACBS|nr:uncharacterized protein LACBIDRAFT_247029 [Laccaria bicolor S238N-H82]EDR11848.1 predicted protein [Laccaria bicolor S238N-H82]|eukprot:XP_001877745.1 predicted protein [Laccaria bicolor S238N-H82]
MSSDPLSTRDPYQLERLAEELAARESSIAHKSSWEQEGELHELPISTPLSHNNKYLTAQVFNAEEFLLSRSHTSLPDLRAELREYLSLLKEELVMLINDDYEAFISLSTDLQDEGARLVRLKMPISSLQHHVNISREELCVIQDAIQRKLTKRSNLREEKALLHLLLKISESVSRLESLLLISTSDGNRVTHLARVAVEYTQLLYHASKAREENCSFINEIQWRIDRIQSTISSDLDNLFSMQMATLIGGKGDHLTECLRTYDILGLWRDAEDVIRRDIMRSFVKKTIYSGGLAAPHSPLVPHTPFNPSALQSTLNTNNYPQTPYTPFTFLTPESLATCDQKPNRHQAHLLEGTDPLVHLFQIMANVIWPELAHAIMDEIGGTVFAAGRPDDFRKNYEITQAFIRSLELLAPSKRAVEALRAHAVYLAFERRWQLPVYFQLRWKEVIGRLEESLSVSTIEWSLVGGTNNFVTVQASAVWVAISACWSAEVYIPELAHRFWRLTLQILSRYKTWLDTSVDFPHETLANNSTTADDDLLRQYASLLIDIKLMETHILGLWHRQIRSLAKLTLSIKPVSNEIIRILTKRCCDALLPVRSIPSQFRAMSNKRTPTEPSYFVSSILRPIKQFFGIGFAEGPGSHLTDHVQDYSTAVFNNVTVRYITYLSSMKKTEESLKRLKKGKKSNFSLFGTAPANDEGRDEERIRAQMILDVEAFAGDGSTLGVDVDTNLHLKTLKEMVETNDGQ